MAAPSFLRSGSLRRLLVFLLIPVVVHLHYASWYGSRSVQYFYFSDLGWDSSSIGMTYGVLIGVAVVGMLCGGALGAAVGARLTLMAGLAVAGVGLLGLTVAPGVAAAVVLGLVAFGHGMVTPSVSAAVADAFPRPKEAFRAAALALVYAAVNGGAMVGSLGAPAAYAPFGYIAVFVVAGLLALLAVPLVVPLLLAPAGPPETDPTTRVHLPALIASVALLIFLVVPISLRNHAFQQSYITASTLSGGANTELWMSVNPATILAATVPLAALLALLGFAKIRIPDLLPAGVGLLLSALATAVLAVPPTLIPAPLAAVGMVLGALGELLASVFIISRIAGDAHWRLSTPLLGAWFAGTYVVAGLLEFVAQPDYSGSGLPLWFMVVAVVVVGLAGLVITIAAIPLHRFAYAVPEPAASGEE
jgi:MFS family permease